MITWTVHNSSVVNCWAKEALKNSWTIRLSCQYFSLGGERYRGAATHPRPFRDPEVALPAVSCETYCASGLPGWVRSVVGSFLVKSSLHCAWISWRIHVWTLFSRLRDDKSDKVNADSAIDEWFVGLLTCQVCLQTASVPVCWVKWVNFKQSWNSRTFK